MGRSGKLKREEIAEAMEKVPEWDLPYFVETGTYKGETSLVASRIFQKVFTSIALIHLDFQTMKKSRNI